MDDLPNYFDVIVVGTGMPECIIAAAAARIGKKVLHLDRSNYYGGDWASFSYDKFLDWINETKESSENTNIPEDVETNLRSFLREEEGETLVMCPSQCKSVTNLHYQTYIRDSPECVTSAVFETSSPIIDIQESISSDLQNEPSEAVISNESTENNEGDGEAQNNVVQTSSNVGTSQQNLVSAHHEWTLSTFMENRRKFNIDLAPKIMFSRGSLVELLISSNIARYAEFQCVNRVLTYINGHIQQVPCSRADVFSTKNVSVVEKRMLMKFLNFCLKFEEQGEEFKGFENQPFVDFLRSKKLTPNVEHFIVHAIAMVPESCNTMLGLKATQKFLQSLGRYGNSPFLCTCYGSAELPQCFCRLCAVYEGMYYLNRKVEGIILKDNRCCAVVSMGQRIDCQWLVMESSYAPQEYISTDSIGSLSRAILITDSSLCPSEKKEITLLKFPPCSETRNPITIIELSSKNYVCPEDLYLVYLYCRSSGGTAEDDLKPIINLLFRNEDNAGDTQEGKPHLLWNVFYNVRDTSVTNLNSNIPAGISLTSSPDIDLDYEHAVKEAHDIFAVMYPGEEFLPRAPDPEDILIESQNNPGDEENVGKIENDVKDSEGNEEKNVQNDVVQNDDERNVENDNVKTVQNDDVQNNESEKQASLKTLDL